MNSLLLSITIMLAVLLSLLAIPLSLSFSISRNQQLQGYTRISWLFGLVKFQTDFPGKTRLRKHKKPSTTKKSNLHKADNNGRNFVSLFKQQQFRQHIIKFLNHMLRATHAKDLYLLLRIGLGDPADTGMLWAIMGPVSGMFKNLQGITVNIEPEFIDAVIEIESHGRFRFIPLQFIALILAFICSPVTIRAWRSSQQVKH